MDVVEESEDSRELWPWTLLSSRKTSRLARSGTILTCHLAGIGEFLSGKKAEPLAQCPRARTRLGLNGSTGSA